MTNLRFRHFVRRDRENQKYKAAHSVKRVLYRTASLIMMHAVPEQAFFAL